MAAAIVFLSVSTAQAATRTWNVSLGGWSTPANWGGTEPTSSDTAYITNGGTATVTQSGEACSYLYLGGADTGMIQMTGGGLYVVHVEYVGYNGTGIFSQSAGTNQPAYLYIGHNSGSNGTYDLHGTGRLSISGECMIGYSGAGSLIQSGGTNTISGSLYLGYKSGSQGTYNLSGTGKLSAADEYIGNNSAVNALFQQSGGTNTAARVLIAASGQYVLSGGSLHINGGLDNQGTMDFAGGPAVVNVAENLIVNLARPGSSLQNTAGATVNVAAGSLLIVPSGFDPYVNFAHYSNAGILHAAGSSLTIDAGQTMSLGWGNIDDPVNCQGTISGGMLLNGGLMISGEGNVNLGGGSLRIEDGNSGMTGGQLRASGHYVGRSTSGTFTQSGGTSSPYWLYVGYDPGSHGTYNLSDTGQISAQLWIGWSGTGTFNQSGGTNSTYVLYLGYKSGSDGTYNLSGTGRLSVTDEYIGYDSSACGLFEQSGGTNTTETVTIGIHGEYRLSAGCLQVSVGLDNQGTMDFGGGPAVLNVAENAIVNLARPGSTLRNTEGATVNVAAGGLLIVPSGFDPDMDFAHCNNAGILHTAGTTLTVDAGQTISGRGSIDDAVVCRGTILGSISLNRGLLVSDGGSVSARSMQIEDVSSGIGSGSIQVVQHYVGKSGIGAFTQSGGTNAVGVNPNLSGSLYLGYAAGSYGTYKLGETGFLSVVYGDEHIGSSGTGTFLQTGGTNNCMGLWLGYSLGSHGIYDLSGTGKLSCQTALIGASGDGSFIQSGGTITASNLYLGYGDSHGVYDLTGGTLILQSLGKGSGTAAFNFGGGTLRASASFTTTLAITLTGTNGNANIDTAGYSVWFGGVLSGPGGLAKQGSGILVLAASPNYGGSTIISDGTLRLSGSSVALPATTSVSLSGIDAKLDTSGNSESIGSLAGVAGSEVKLGGGTLTTGGNNNSTTFAGSLTSSTGGSLCKNGTGIFTLSGTNTFTGPVQFDGGLINATVLANLGNGSALRFNGGGLQFGGVFDPSVRTMTFLAGGATLDTQSLNITLANSIGNNGPGGLVKKGAGTLLLAGSNTYGGTTTVTAGTLELAEIARGPILSGAGVNVENARSRAVFDYTTASPAGDFLTKLIASYGPAAGPHWTDGQFRSATADAKHGLGWIDNASASPKSVAVMYTLYGDADLDGAVTSADLFKLLSKFNQSGNWSQGDTNYDGLVTSSDFFKLLASYNQTLPTSLGASLTAVPEPSSMLLLGLALLGLAARARRKRDLRLGSRPQP